MTCQSSLYCWDNYKSRSPPPGLPKYKWSFVVHNKLGSIIKQIPLDNLPFIFQTLINENRLQPGWINHPHCSAFQVSAKNLQNPCPPTLSKALHSSNSDRNTWLDSYKQEVSDIQNMDVYDEISIDEYDRIQHRCGKPIPTMCVLTIKCKNGYLDQAKCRIVVLGNQQDHTYSKNEKYAPVITQNQFRYLLLLAIKHKRFLRQGDVKNAFCNGHLPEDEVVVIRPPKGCPISRPNTLWWLKKTLYGLVRSPLHWFNNISSFFKSIGLQNSPNSPCIFSIPGKPPLYEGLYVNAVEPVVAYKITICLIPNSIYLFIFLVSYIPSHRCMICAIGLDWSGGPIKT